MLSIRGTSLKTKNQKLRTTRKPLRLYRRKSYLCKRIQRTSLYHLKYNLN